MELPAFAKRRGDLVWTWNGRTLVTHTAEVTFAAQSAWYSRRWTVTGVGALALPAEVTAYVSRDGGAHGYWRNAPPGLRDYFGYADTPALMPLVVGAATRRAIARHDRPDWASDPEMLDTRQPLALHIRGGSVETTTKVDDKDSTVIEDQLAVHRALAEDHAAVLASWQRAADALGGQVASVWPPVLTVPRGFGTIAIALRWPATTQPGAQATIELAADARGAPLWLIEREPRPTPASQSIGDRHYMVVGDIPVALDDLARVVARADVLSIHVRRHVTVQIVASTPDVAVIEAVLELLAQVCSGATGPYR